MEVTLKITIDNPLIEEYLSKWVRHLDAAEAVLAVPAKPTPTPEVAAAVEAAMPAPDAAVPSAEDVALAMRTARQRVAPKAKKGDADFAAMSDMFRRAAAQCGAEKPSLLAPESRTTFISIINSFTTVETPF